ncbi:MAG TPA: DMT family transporter [Thermoanaerobaculia bacterium]|nr:DMT family transporter [Thermoanaerobaculia bacterium]
MSTAIVLALIASFCTATSSVCQRIGATTAPTGDKFTLKLLLYLARNPMWLAGVASLILGFVFQVVALHFGGLALVQPIFATELIFVFGYMALIGRRSIRKTDWMAAVAMAAGLSVFLFTAAPSGGRVHPPAALWWLAGISAVGLAAVVTVAAYVPLRRGSRPSPARKAATIGIATGISWGFVAAVIKEMSTHRTLGSALSSWTPYVLICVGGLSMLLAAHALQAGPLAASQPGFTIVDPLVASLLGIFVFSEHLQLDPGDLAVEALSLAALVWGVITLSHSRLIHDEDPETLAPEPPVNVRLNVDV